MESEILPQSLLCSEIPHKPAPAIRVAIVDDMKFFADLLGLLCRDSWGLDLVAVAYTGHQGYEDIIRTKPDVVLLDLCLPDVSGIDLAGKISAALPSARIIFVSGSWNAYLIHRLSEVRFQGFVDKVDDAFMRLQRAIELVHLGGTYFSPRYIIAARDLRRSETAFFKRLSAREQEVLVWAAQALSDEEIALQLGISTSTAQTHRREIMRKLDIPSTPKLIRYGMELGICNGFVLPAMVAKTDSSENPDAGANQIPLPICAAKRN